MSDPRDPTPCDPSDLELLELRVATVLSARENPRARVPTLVVELDLGPERGRRTSSARLAADYTPAELVGTQVVVVDNLAPRRIAGVDSQVLILAAVVPTVGTRLLRVDGQVPAGTPVS